MNATTAVAGRSPARTWTIVILSATALVALWFLARHAMPYLKLSEAHFGPYFWPRRWELVLHIAGGSIALVVGVVQVWLGLTNRTTALHRTLGKLYVAVIALGSIAGFYLALTIRGNLPYASGLFFLCVAWVVTTAMAVLSIRRRNLLQHREWMLRSYVVTFAFVTFRIGVDAMTSWGVALADSQAIMAWACWALPLLLLEPLLQLRKVRGSR